MFGPFGRKAKQVNGMKIPNRLFAFAGALFLGVGTSFAGPRVYVPLGAAGQVQIIDAQSVQVVGAITDVGNAHGLAITPDERYLVVGSFSEQAQQRTDSTPRRPDSVSEAEHEKHHAKPQGPVAESVGMSAVSVIDTATRKVVRRVAVRGAVHHVAISPNGRFAVTTHPGRGGISVIDLERFEVVATVKTGSAPNYATFSGDGRNVFVSNAGDNNVSEVDTTSWLVSRHIPTGQSPEHLVLSPDGQTLYTNNVVDGTAVAISLAKGQVTRTFPIGATLHGIDLSADGTTLFAISNGDNKLVAIDLASGRTRQISLSPAPYHLTVVRGIGALFVSSRAQNRIWVIDQQTLEKRGVVVIDGIGHQMAVASR